MLHMFSKNVEKNSSCCSQITEKHTHTHIMWLQIGAYCLSHKTNLFSPRLFGSAVFTWESIAGRRLWWRLTQLCRKVGEWEMGKMKGNIVAAQGNPHGGGGGGGGWRWADTNQNQKRTPWVYMTTADTCASVIWNDTTSELHDSCSSSSYLKMHFSPTNPNNRTLN